MTDSKTIADTRKPKPQAGRKPRRIGHVGQAYLEAVERANADKRAKNAAAMRAIIGSRADYAEATPKVAA